MEDNSGYYESTGQWFDPTKDGRDKYIKPKSYDELVNEVWDIISSMVTKAEDNRADLGILMSLSLPRSLRIDEGVVQGAVNRGEDASVAVRNAFILFCVALLQQDVSKKEIEKAMAEAFKVNG